MVKQLHTRGELITCLRKNPSQRRVSYITSWDSDVMDADASRAVIEFRDGRALSNCYSPYKIIARIVEGSEAAKLFDEIYATEECGSSTAPNEREASTRSICPCLTSELRRA